MDSNVIYQLLMFYTFQFHDYFTTILGLRLKPDAEKNPIAKIFSKSPLMLALYKFSLCNIIPLYSLLVLHTVWFIYADTLFEGVVVINNIYKLRIYKLRM